MNIDEFIQQPGQKDRIFRDEILKSLHVALPGEIVAYDDSKRTATIQPVIRDWGSKDSPPLLLDVPVFFGGNYTFVPQKGDGCLVVFADSCIDAWLKSGGVSTPSVARMHSLSDGFAFVGFRQSGGKNVGALLDILMNDVGELKDNIQLPQKIIHADQTETITSVNDFISLLDGPGRYFVETSGTSRPTLLSLGLIPENTYGILEAIRLDEGEYNYYLNYRGENNKRWFATMIMGFCSVWQEVAIKSDLDALSGKFYTAISFGTDLNSLTTPGFYGVLSGATASSLVHTPITDDGFVLQVFNKGNTVVQVVTSGYGYFMRGQSSSGFSNWEELALNSKVTKYHTTTSVAFPANQQSGNIRLIRSGNVRQLSFVDAKLPANATYFTFTTSTLAESDRPKVLTENVMRVGSGGGIYLIWIRPSGTFGQAGGTAGALVDGSLTWLV